MGLLEGKVALVAGVGPGLGLESARAFAAQGASVVLMARRKEALEAAWAVIVREGGRATVFAGDVSDPAACEAAVAHASDHFGGLDILVANAFLQGTQVAPTQTSAEDWHSVIDVNLLGPLWLTRSAAPRMAKRGGGSIIMVASNQTWELVPGFSAYAASKSALVSLTRHLAAELGAQRIRVNAVHPGLIMGDPVRGFLANLAEQQGCSEEAAYQQVAGRAALNHIASPEEMSGTLVFFASDLSRVVTGQSLCVDAGLHFH